MQDNKYLLTGYIQETRAHINEEGVLVPSSTRKLAFEVPRIVSGDRVTPFRKGPVHITPLFKYLKTEDYHRVGGTGEVIDNRAAPGS